MSGSRLFLAELDRLALAREDFAFETTLSGLVYLRRLKRWETDGYCIEIGYLQFRPVTWASHLDRDVQIAAIKPHPQYVMPIKAREFVPAWCVVAYLFPGLHPDGFDHPDSGWPRGLKRIAAESWRRADAGELADEALYACDAQWSGLFDRMVVHVPEETERRVELTAAYGERLD